MTTRAYVDALRAAVEAGRDAEMTIVGSSMAPFLIYGRDAVRFRAPDGPLRPGDILFFRRDSGQYVLHRLRRVTPEGLYLIGDAQTVTEGPIAPDRVFARAIAVRRKGRWYGPESRLWRFFAGPWLHLIPLRPALIFLTSLPSRSRKD